jgi:colanic acid biosynthesis protein WcaH
MLSLKTFKIIVDSTPLISIDFIVRNKIGQVLLGKRTNSPARGFWFVPGGRVLKNETLESAFQRLKKSELGKARIDCKFKGIYQHMYDDSFVGSYVSTHYIVLAYEMLFDTAAIEELPTEQHSNYKWFSESELLESTYVHQYTKWYFQSNTAADAAFTI